MVKNLLSAIQKHQCELYFVISQNNVSTNWSYIVPGMTRSQAVARIDDRTASQQTLVTARCTLVQSAVLRSHVCPSVRLSVRPSVTLVNCDHIGWNSSKIISPLVSLGRSLFATPTRRVCSKGNTPKFSPE